MVERLVDVYGSHGVVIHTYPVTLPATDLLPSEAGYEAKALEAAAHGRLVPDSELGTLTARMHVSRGGQMEPFGDTISNTSETKLGLEQAIRERAYCLWDNDGRPEGRSEEYWNRALEQHLKDRSYVSWQQEGSPSGGADERWDRTREFQAQ
jgi:hypothetical protein